MLSPDTRTIAIDLLRPPAGCRLDKAVLTTYSLDLEALLALPLAVLAHADGGMEELLADPLLLLEALRQAGDRIHLFVDEGGIAIPRADRALYALLESSVHPVRAPNGGAFHPKVWFVRFLDADDAPLLRVAVLSRNLTFDRSWDIALASEGRPAGRRRRAQSRALGNLLRALPDFATQAVAESVAADLQLLTGEVERTLFPSPEGFDGVVAFEALGLVRRRNSAWRPLDRGTRLIAIAPFANATGLNALSSIATGERTLISRQDTLDSLPEDLLEPWDRLLVLSDVAEAEVDDAAADQPTGLHAKAIGIEYDWDVSWFVGSANLTAAAFLGRNVELMASMTGRKGRSGGRTGFGIDRFLEAGFGKLCETYHRCEQSEPDIELIAALERLDAARKRLLADGALRVVCASDGESWNWSLTGKLEFDPGIEIAAWPVSVGEDQAKPLSLPLIWHLPAARLTTFVAFRLRTRDVKVDDVRLTLKLPAEGMPENRLAQVLRTLIDSPERFLRFLRALLGGLDGLVDWSFGNGSGSEVSPWGVGLQGETLLEDLIRVASREPERLRPVRRLIHDLRATEEGRVIVPDDLFALWTVVDEALGESAKK